MFISDFEDLFGLRRDLDRVLNCRMTGNVAANPPMNVYAEGEDIVVSVEVPGVDSKDLDISVNGKILQIKGERRAEPSEAQQKYLRRESTSGKFARTLELPYEVQGDKIDALYQRGILTIRLPRAEREKPKRIEIRAN